MPSVTLPKLSSRASIVQDSPGQPSIPAHYDFIELFNQLSQTTQDQLNQLIAITAAISWPVGVTIQGVADGATAKVTISAHTRVSLTTAVSLDAGEVTGLAYATTYYISYDDPTRAGGAVTYQAFTDVLDAFASVDNPYRLNVGSVITPATAIDPPTDGTPAGPPGQQPV